MIIDVRGAKLDITPSLQRHVERAVRNALDRFENRVEFVEITLSDVKGNHHKGDAMQCQLVIALRHAPKVIVEQCDRDLYVAVDQAAGRAKRAVRRSINRLRDLRQRHRVGVGETFNAMHPAM